MTKSDEEFFKERGFGLRMGFGRVPAIVAVDFVRAFTDPDMMLGSNLDNELEVANRVLDEAHRRKVPVFFTTVAYSGADLEDAGIWVLKQKGTVTLRAGTPSVELDPRLHRAEGDSLVVKKYASSFFGTDLVSRLVSRGIDTVILIGCTTSGCIRATAVDALQNGFRPMIVREAVGDRSEAAHEQSLFDLDAKYGDVVTAGEVLSYLSSQTCDDE
ncbi:MAG: carbamoylsarcosine amidase [Spongiibacter sp.]|uniref:isochorismatase family protein n=1 Tax=Spongiibacter sp. TaxID=2024860 RepID=UPI000C0AC227|nr:isochorismatase family protein [Spongiibacter sp.]MAK43297.1 carbamoylsarcosine amidase [Spongiibacter sp.]|tara:strand:+ start:502 stop:1146 length:645 start_codon:yes stop_codon:yes gene_type:complete